MGTSKEHFGWVERMRGEFKRNSFTSLKKMTNYIEEETDALWAIEDLFVQTLYETTQEKCGTGVLFIRESIGARPHGDEKFRLEVETKKRWNLPSGLHLDTIGFGMLNGKRLSLPFDIREAYRDPLREFSPTINSEVIPYLKDLFLGYGFTVIQRDELFVPDEIFEQHSEANKNLRREVFSPIETTS